MNSDRIFIGTIYILNEFVLLDNDTYISKVKEDISEEENCILIKLKDKEYVRLEDFHMYFALRKIFPEFMEHKMLKIEDSFYLKQGESFIKENELKPYLSVNTDVSLKQIKKRQAR